MVFPRGSKSQVSVQPVSINYYYVISKQYIEFRKGSMLKCPAVVSFYCRPAVFLMCLQTNDSFSK